MSSVSVSSCAGLSVPDIGALLDEVVELSVLVPGWQLGALEKSARDEGLTTAQLVRHLIQRHLDESYS